MYPKKPEEALNGDAITGILIRLPAKSVCRFRCVSKLWFSLISDPHFIMAHAAAVPPAPCGFYLFEPAMWQAEFIPLNGGGGGGSLQDHDPTLSFLDYKGIPPEPVDSCNGLLLCRLHNKFKSDPFVLSVYSPTNNAHEVIPLSQDIRLEIMSACLCLAFDPRRSSNYRVLAWVRASGLNHPLMYKSESQSWKLIEDVRMSYWPMPSPLSVYWKGSLVWSVNSKMIAALDVESEQIQELFLPQPRKMNTFLHLAASGDGLHYIRGENTIRFEILEMSSVSSGWHLLHSVDLVSIQPLCDHHFHFHFVFILEFIGGDEDWLLLRTPNKIFSYHLQRKIFSTICQVHPGMYWYKIFPLAHTLYFPLIDVPPSQEWVCWKSEHDQLLISLMVEHSHNCKKITNGFQIDAWHEMVRTFNQITRLNYDVLHLENRLKSYKQEYQTVKKILATDGFHWSPSEKLVNASDANWQEISKINSKALVYKRKQVPYEDLEIICASSVRIHSNISQNTCHCETMGTQPSLALFEI